MVVSVMCEDDDMLERCSLGGRWSWLLLRFNGMTLLAVVSTLYASRARLCPSMTGKRLMAVLINSYWHSHQMQESDTKIPDRLSIPRTLGGELNELRH